jgi:hypothetical protein
MNTDAQIYDRYVEILKAGKGRTLPSEAAAQVRDEYALSSSVNVLIVFVRESRRRKAESKEYTP